MAVDALGDAAHFGVAVPVESLSLGHYDVEESEFGFAFDGECDDAVRRLYIVHDLVDFWYFESVELFDEEAEVRGLDEGLGVEVVVFGGYSADEVEDVGECGRFFEHTLELFELLGFEHGQATLIL